MPMALSLSLDSSSTLEVAVFLPGFRSSTQAVELSYIDKDEAESVDAAQDFSWHFSFLHLHFQWMEIHYLKSIFLHQNYIQHSPGV